MKFIERGGMRSERSKADGTVLYSGPIYRFADWPNVSVPNFGAGVYTIWHFDGRFVYVGMSGRGIAADTKRRNTPHGIYTRLARPILRLCGGSSCASDAFSRRY